VRTIKKQVTRRVLDLLAKVAEERPAEYLEFWQKFGVVIKEGLHFDPSHADKIAALLRYESSADAGFLSLAEYVKRMPEGQTKIYYAQGPSKALLAGTPHLEALKAQGYDVLFMTQSIDQWALEGLREFDGKPLVDAMREDTAESETKKSSDTLDDAAKARQADLAPLLARCKAVLEAHVSDVRISDRLTDSPACLVIPRGGIPAHIERLLRTHQEDLPEQKRILELNAKHPIVLRMQQEYARSADSETLSEWIELLHDQALVAEGSPLPDPVRFSKRVVALMQNSAPPAA
jgi:molecular chaperone HtpG